MLNLMDADFARWRAWAADLRDAGGPHAETAGLLCRVLDLHHDLSRRAARPALRRVWPSPAHWMVPVHRLESAPTPSLSMDCEG